MNAGSWREQALAAIRDGFCPNGHGPLDENGFCLHCGDIGVHYSVKNGDTVVAAYPEQGL
jgi:hypothetical protein